MRVKTPYIAVISRVNFPQNTLIEKIKKHPVRDALNVQSVFMLNRCVQDLKVLGLYTLSDLYNLSVTLPFVPMNTGVPATQQTYKQFLNYQGVNYTFSGRKTGRNRSKFHIFKNVFTGVSGHKSDSPLRHIDNETPVLTGVLLFLQVKPGGKTGENFSTVIHFNTFVSHAQI